MARVADIMAAMEGMAPGESAQPWDNVGLLLGSAHAQVDAVLLCIDVTPEVIREAKGLGAQLIISHHPILFSATRRLDYEDYEARLISSLIGENIALFAAHTNLDIAPEGVARALAQKLGLAKIALHGFFALGSAQPLLAWQWKERAQNQLEAMDVRLFGDGMRKVSTIACAPGSGGDFVKAARAMGAEALITGEMKHHEILAGLGEGMPIIEAGHFYSERPVLAHLMYGLQKWADEVQSKVRFFVSALDPYRALDYRG